MRRRTCGVGVDVTATVGVTSLVAGGGMFAYKDVEWGMGGCETQEQEGAQADAHGRRAEQSLPHALLQGAVGRRRVHAVAVETYLPDDVADAADHRLGRVCVGRTGGER